MASTTVTTETNAAFLLRNSEDVKDINPEARKLLETYSNIPADQVFPHVLKLVRIYTDCNLCSGYKY